MNLAMPNAMRNILTSLTTKPFAPKPVKKEVFVKPVTKVLEFTDQQVTQAVIDGTPIFEWDGTKGMISEYALKEQAGEWRLKIVAKHTQQTRGLVVAVPTGRRTMNIYKDAKTREMEALGMSSMFARLYLNRSRGVRYNMEHDVMNWVYRNYLMSQSDLDKIIDSIVPKETAHYMDYDLGNISQARFASCLEIVTNLRKGDDLIKYTVAHVAELVAIDDEEYFLEDIHCILPKEGVQRAMQLAHAYYKVNNRLV